MFNVGDVCELRPFALADYGPFIVCIRDATKYDIYEYTVEYVGPTDAPFWKSAFHLCEDGPVKFQTKVGRWANENELTLIRKAVRQATKFAKFIRKIEGK